MKDKYTVQYNLRRLFRRIGEITMKPRPNFPYQCNLHALFWSPMQNEAHYQRL
jgi:hypothetical protein